ncbi:MAG: cob(I)yrinic acid a,c-diamide adenosyltransferase [Nitrososphaerota archaeon]|nr:cob(I)yrinic acid a,c-diamide adenosyltransferase [Candidatus Calditenuaceae archaeon]MDW8073516.1 cob(I)yrinic acid a,c-diamide adenosyltransferase [Nitrososphaerota archaeon]
MGRYGSGDEGETGLFGGWRVSKSDPRVECYGEVDELSSVIGLCRAHLGERHREVDTILRSIQEALFRMAAELASIDPSRLGIELVGEKDVAFLEEHIGRIEAQLPQLRHFIYPGGSLPGSMLHVARAVARRAERRVVALSSRETVNPAILKYLNRLSTLLFHLARHVNAEEGVTEDIWRGRGLG